MMLCKVAPKHSKLSRSHASAGPMAHGIIKRERESRMAGTHIFFFNSKLQEGQKAGFSFHLPRLSTGLKPFLSLVWGFTPLNCSSVFYICWVREAASRLLHSIFLNTHCLSTVFLQFLVCVVCVILLFLAVDELGCCPSFIHRES